MSSSSTEGAEAGTNPENRFFSAWTRDQTPDQSWTTTTNNGEGNESPRLEMSASPVQYRYQRPRLFRKTSLDRIPENPQQEETEIIRSTRAAAYHKGARRSPLKARTFGGRVRGVVFFVPNLVVKLLWTLLRYVLYIPLSIAAPSFWLSALLWVFWKVLRFPMGLLRYMASGSGVGSTSSTARSAAPAAKRTVLISCGSTIQTLHLARNFYSSGARVVVFEFDGLFGLARFSAAVDKFYIVPRPTAHNPDSYINALYHIVKKERPSVYIPVSVTSPAYYDALAKPHLELLGCASFVPGVQDTLALDDCLEFFRKCTAHGIELPPHSVLRSVDDLTQLYDSGFISNFRNILIAVGTQGLLERYKYILPNNSREFKFNHEISERNQWLVVRDLPGEHYITCTTIKDSRIVANVTCRVDHETKNLIPMMPVGKDNGKSPAELQVEQWIKFFFATVRFPRKINGHLSFRMVRCQGSDRILPLGIRLGVSLPYICYNRSHPQILSRTMKCSHILQLRPSGQEDESVLATLSANLNWACLRKNSNMALDKREALFAYWDPLPYCAFYHFQLPLESVKLFLQNRHRSAKSLSQRITMPVH